jgi:hypothetical protein
VFNAAALDARIALNKRSLKINRLSKSSHGDVQFLDES